MEGTQETMTETIAEVDADKQASYAEKIAKLLRKAETTDSDAEAEALTAKAQELMVTYAIDEAMLTQARGGQKQEEITTITIKYTGIFQAALMDIGNVIAVANNCKAVFSKNTWSKPTCHDLTIIGFESDLHRVQMLDASLQIQCASAMRHWWKSEDRSWYSKMDAFKSKRDFIIGFASGASTKLQAAKRAGQAEAVKHEAARAGSTAEAASTGVELVLRSRQEQVKDWYDNTYGRTTRSVTRRYQSGVGSGRQAGYGAGRSANTGTTGIGTRGAIGR